MRTTRLIGVSDMFNSIGHLIRFAMPEREIQTDYLGHQFCFPSRSQIGMKILDGAEWDGAMFRLILPKLLLDNPTIIEVGSNIGASTLVINEICNSARFLLIEPSDRFYKYLINNVAFIKNIVGIDRRVVSDVCNEIAVLKTNSTTGTPSNADYGHYLTSTQSIQTVTIDTLCMDYSLDSVDLIKVDTDGFEYEVFKGAANTIEKYKPIIHAEFSPNSLKRMHPDNLLIELLHDYGCNLFLVFKPNGAYAGPAKSYQEIITLKGNDYYVDLLSAPIQTRYCEVISEFANHEGVS